MAPKILIADDEESIRKILARMLEPEGYEVLHARNGEEALQTIQIHLPDLIILDIHMPIQDGWQVLRTLRDQPRTRLIPAILLTTRGTLSDKVYGLGLGADDYLTKPFSLQELSARVETILRRTQMNLAANPLTRLPGSPMIEADVNRRIQAGSLFAFLYIDLNHFKSYNDYYGYAAGDRVLIQTAAILMRCIEEKASGSSFLGHIGGDDFVIVTDLQAAPELAQSLAISFDQLAPSFYQPQDRHRGFLEVKNRQGRLERFPLLSLSIGVATNERRRLDHYAKVVQIASEMKSYCKSRPTHLSHFAFDRRTDPSSSAKEDRQVHP